MPVVTFLLVLIAQAAPSGEVNAARNSPQGYRPAGSPSELRDLSLLSLLRDTRARSVGFSSYDRSGGNNDGFNGTYSRLRVENGASVLAEADGPGIVQRIWFTHTTGEAPGLLDRKKEHVKIYLDGRPDPVLDIPLERVFAGDHPAFPRPLVSEGSGGFVSYVPIPFKNGCKIVVDGLGVRFYQINLLLLPSAAGLASFSPEPNAAARAELQRAVALWTHPETYDDAELAASDLARYEVEGRAHSTHEFALRNGPATVRSLRIVPDPDSVDAWKSARLRLTWDQDSSEKAGVDLPLGHAFGWAPGSAPYRSLLLGQEEQGWYNRFPMPYRRDAVLRIDTSLPLKGKIHVRTVAGVHPDAGYFHAAFREAVPTLPKQDFTWLKEDGRGHFAGVLLMTEGKAKLPYWLEGDDRFRVDGRLAVHGTGSEDYFNCGWYALPGRLDRPAAYPLHGFPVYREQAGAWQASAYRWHLADPVPYARSIEAGIEHGGDNQFSADYRAAVFWYSDQPVLSESAMSQTGREGPPPAGP